MFSGRRMPLVCCAVCCCLWMSPVFADVFSLSWYTVDGGGATFTTGGALTLSGTIGQADAGEMTGGSIVLVGGFWPGAYATALGDCDGSGIVDLDDYACFNDCITGPGIAATTECQGFDFDTDDDVDLRDFADFQMILAAR